MDAIAIIKDILNIFFFISVSTVTILSYLQAKKTIFSPIKAEVFKFQLEQFKEILSMLQDKSELEFCHQFDFDGLIHVNSVRMVNSYSTAFFGKKIFDTDKTEKLICGALVSEKNIREAGHIKPDNEETIAKTNTLGSVSMTPSLWKEDPPGLFYLTKKHFDNSQKLQTLIRSPLLPSDIKNELKALDKIIHKNIASLVDSFVSCSLEMPEKFDSLETLYKFSDAWISNRFNKSRIPFQTQAQAVLDAISNYLMVEEIIKR